MGLTRQSKSTGVGLPLPTPGDLPDPGIELQSPAMADGFLTTETPGHPSHDSKHPQIYISNPGFSQELLAYISNYLLDILF